MADLLFTVNHPDISGGHRTVACNLLCTVISQCSQSSIDEFRAVVWDGQTWLNAFAVFLTQNGALSVKPLRQLLTGLTTALDNCQDKSVSGPIRDTTLYRLVSILCSTTEHVPIRPATQALTHFLIKKIVTTEDVYSVICTLRARDAAEDNPVNRSRVIMEVVLQWAPYDDYSSSAGLLASAVLENVERDNPTSPTPLAFHTKRHVSWAESVLRVLKEEPTRLENYRHYVFPELLKHSTHDFVAFLELLDLHSVLGSSPANENPILPQDLLENVLFCALSVGSKIGSVQVAEGGRDTLAELFLTQSSLCIPDTLLGSLLLRTSTTVRIAGLSMLVISNTTSKPLSSGTIRSLKAGLPYLHAEADAGFRSEMLSLVRNLVDRLRGASAGLDKLATGHVSKGAKAKAGSNKVLTPAIATRQLEAHRKFLEWYLSFLRMELRPNASYQRHISAVKTIAVICRSGVDPRALSNQHPKTTSSSALLATTWPFELDVVDGAMTDLLLDLLLDPYDDVRQGAAELLSTVTDATSSKDTAQSGHVPRLVHILRRAEHMMMLSGRADQADGVAHLYNIIYSRCPSVTSSQPSWWTSKVGVLEHLVSSLEHTLSIAAEDMGKAVNKHPLHGTFISLR